MAVSPLKPYIGGMKVSRETLSLPRAVEAEVEIVAIGDIHGRSDLLDALLDEAAAEPSQAPERKVVFLGDLVDRGPDSLGCLALAAEADERLGAAETVGLYGNHEILMRMALDPDSPPRAALAAMEVWLRNGGGAVARELLGENVESASLADLREAAPDWALGWLQGLQPHMRSGDLLFVHAGVNPRTPLESFLARPWDESLGKLEESGHWAWVRGPFLTHDPGKAGFSGLFVVHGHTPLDRGHTKGHAEQVRRWRLNLDGGSAMTGIAKMAFLRGGVAEVVTVQA